MKFNLIFEIVFLDSLFFSISFAQQWNFFNSAIELLSPLDTASVNITVMDETKDGINIKLYKYFAKGDGNVIYKKYIKVFYNGDEIYDQEVPFDKIDNYYRFDGKIIICPKGKYHPILCGDNFLSNFEDLLKEFEDWELQCIYPEQNYFMIIYLMKGKYHFFSKKSSSPWNNQEVQAENRVFKLLNHTSKSSDIDFTLAYIANDTGVIQLKVISFKINGNNGLDDKYPGSFQIMNAKTYTRGCFERNKDHFYFLTYSDNNFSCGYYDSTDNIDANIEQKYRLTIGIQRRR